MSGKIQVILLQSRPKEKKATTTHVSYDDVVMMFVLELL